LGSALENFCVGPTKKISETFKELTVRTFLGRKDLLKSLYHDYQGAPSWWAEDVRASIDWMDEYLIIPEFWIPEYFREDVKKYYDYCRMFGKMVKEWPEIYSRSIKLGTEFLDKYRIS